MDVLTPGFFLQTTQLGAEPVACALPY